MSTNDPYGLSRLKSQLTSDPAGKGTCSLWSPLAQFGSGILPPSPAVIGSLQTLQVGVRIGDLGQQVPDAPQP